METTPETKALMQELYERAATVADLNGPQIEAWVSGLFSLFDENLTASAFAEHCAAERSAVGAIIVAAIAELTLGLDAETASRATTMASDLEQPVEVAQIGTSRVSGAWSVTAPFGRSIVLGFDNPNVPPVPEEDLAGGVEPADLRHSILVEIGDDALVEDLQLAGPAIVLLDEATASDTRVKVEPIDVEAAVADIVGAWPEDGGDPRRFGPGVGSNQQFVRRRIAGLNGVVLAPIRIDAIEVDMRRGLDDSEFAAANRAALSTLKAALRLDVAPFQPGSEALVDAWMGVIRGDIGDLALRERDALLWLEWADWLGAGIGLWRAGAGCDADPATLVDHVNRCPEVSSTISKADRDYAEWAFSIALDLLQDAGVVEDGVLTDQGHAALAPAMFAAWSNQP